MVVKMSMIIIGIDYDNGGVNDDEDDNDYHV